MIIYKAINLINGKIYVGQTIQTLRQRINGHYIKCKKKSSRFHIALCKYKKENWSWKIIETCSSNKELDKRETYWIKKLNTLDRKFGYNSSSGGQGLASIVYNPGMTNKNHTEKSKDKIRKAFKGKKRSEHDIEQMRKYYKENPNRPKRVLSEEHKNSIALSKLGSKNPMYGKKSPRLGTGIKVYQFDINGSLIKEWDNSNIASDKLSIDRGAINKRCKKELVKPYKGFLWSYKNKLSLND